MTIWAKTQNWNAKQARNCFDLLSKQFFIAESAPEKLLLGVCYFGFLTIELKLRIIIEARNNYSSTFQHPCKTRHNLCWQVKHIKSILTDAVKISDFEIIESAIDDLLKKIKEENLPGKGLDDRPVIRQNIEATWPNIRYLIHSEDCSESGSKDEFLNEILKNIQHIVTQLNKVFPASE